MTQQTGTLKKRNPSKSVIDICGKLGNGFLLLFLVFFVCVFFGMVLFCFDLLFFGVPVFCFGRTAREIIRQQV